MDPEPFLLTIIFSAPSIGAIVALITAILLLASSGFVSASEISFFSLTPNDKFQIDQHNHSHDSIIKELLDRSEHLLATILIANNLVNIAVVILCNYFIVAIVNFGYSVWLQFLVQTIVLTFLLLLFGEIMPKIYASHNGLKFARFAAPTLRILDKFFYYPSQWLVISSRSINKRVSKHNSNISINEISQALEVTSVHVSEEKQLLQEIVRFGDKDVVDIMIPRVDIIAVDIEANFDELIKLVLDKGYSRLPVYELSLDSIKGIIFIKDLLPYLNSKRDFDWHTLLRPAYFVPETKKIDALLEEFRSTKNHIAIVVDEFGGTSGIVALEDILEEIVGEISDEYDEEHRQWYRLDKDTYLFEGKISVNDFIEAIGATQEQFETVSAEADTLAGLLLEIKEEFPLLHEKVKFKNYAFEVVEMEKRRIVKIKVHLLPTA